MPLRVRENGPTLVVIGHVESTLTDPKLAPQQGSEVLGYPVATETIGQRRRRLLERTEEVVLVAEPAPGQVVGCLHGAEQELLES
jgi:hypothetical protein